MTTTCTSVALTISYVKTTKFVVQAPLNNPVRQNSQDIKVHDETVETQSVPGFQDRYTKGLDYTEGCVTLSKGGPYKGVTGLVDVG